MLLTKNGLPLLVGANWFSDMLNHQKNNEGYGCNRNPLKSKAQTNHQESLGASPTRGNE